MPYHKIDTVQVQSRLDSTITQVELLRASLPRTPDNLKLVANNAWDVVCCTAALHSGAQRAIPYLHTAATANAALSLTANLDEPLPLEVQVAGTGPIIYHNRPSGSLIHPNWWLNSLWICLAARDYDSIDLLYQLSTDQLLASSTRCAEYSILFVQAIVAYLESDSNTASKLIAAMAATDPERPDVLMPDWTLKIDVPIIELFFHTVAGDWDAFHPALQKAVDQYESYWKMSRDADKSRNPTSFIAAGLLGLATLAMEKGQKVDVQSDYLPLWILG